MVRRRCCLPPRPGRASATCRWLAYLSYGAVAAVDYIDKKEGLLMAPAYAVPRMLRDAHLTLQDFDFYEIHEAFAGQVLCTLKAWADPVFCRDKLRLPGALGTIDRPSSM